MYFTDVNASRILKLDAEGRIPTFRQPANRANGMVFDPQFRLLIAEMGDAAAGTASNGRIFHDLYPGRSGDGMSIDSAGNLYVVSLVPRVRTRPAANWQIGRLEDWQIKELI